MRVRQREIEYYYYFMGPEAFMRLKVLYPKDVANRTSIFSGPTFLGLLLMGPTKLKKRGLLTAYTTCRISDWSLSNLPHDLHFRATSRTSYFPSPPSKMGK